MTVQTSVLFLLLIAGCAYTQSFGPQQGSGDRPVRKSSLDNVIDRDLPEIKKTKTGLHWRSPRG